MDLDTSIIVQSLPQGSVYEENSKTFLIPLKSKKGTVHTRITVDLEGAIKLKGKTISGGLSRDKWYARIATYDGGFMRNSTLGSFLIGKPPVGQVVDHINRITTDYRLCNLHHVTKGDNTQNRAKFKENASSKYKGVYFCKNTNKFISQARKDYKMYYLGAYDKEHHAVFAYDQFWRGQSNNAHLNDVSQPEDYVDKIPKTTNRDLPKGIYKVGNKFLAKISIDGSQINLGIFTTRDEAEAAYKKREAELIAEKMQAELKQMSEPLPRNSDGIAFILSSGRDQDLVDDNKYYEIKRLGALRSLCGKDGKVNCVQLLYKSGGAMMLGRHLLGIKKDDIISADHKNRNPLDNRLENLRKSSNSLQGHNRDCKNSSGYAGVWQKGSAFCSKLVHKGKQYQLGHYKTPESAALARDIKAKEIYGDDAYLRFPNPTNEQFDKMKSDRKYKQPKRKASEIIETERSNKRVHQDG